MRESTGSWEERGWRPAETLAAVSLESTAHWVGTPILAVGWGGLVQPRAPHPRDAALCMKCCDPFGQIPPCMGWVLQPALRESSAQHLVLSLPSGHCRASGWLWLESAIHGRDKDA